MKLKTEATCVNSSESCRCNWDFLVKCLKNFFSCFLCLCVCTCMLRGKCESCQPDINEILKMHLVKIYPVVLSKIKKISSKLVFLFLGLFPKLEQINVEYFPKEEWIESGVHNKGVKIARWRSLTWPFSLSSSQQSFYCCCKIPQVFVICDHPLLLILNTQERQII